MARPIRDPSYIRFPLLLLGVTLFSCCFRAEKKSPDPSLAPAVQANRQPASQQRTPKDPLVSGPLIGSQKAEDAWRLFTKDGRYRIASADDFRIPDWAKKAYGHDLERAINDPMVAGWDINRDGAAHDVAAIVVDTTRNEDTRFGLVIFNAPKKPEGVYTPSWLYRQRDLSRSVLSIASSRTFLMEYHDDGSMTACSITWNLERHAYQCKAVK